MSAAKAKKSPKSGTRSAAKGAAKGAVKSAARSAGRSAARTATKTAAKGAASAGSKAVAVGGERIGRGTRWTEDQVSLLLDTVKASATAKEAFEHVARQLGKSTGTVQQKYYNLQKQSGAGSSRRRGRPRTSPASRAGAAAASRTSGGGLPTSGELRSLTVDELVGLATRVKGEVDRRKQELDAAAKLLAS